MIDVSAEVKKNEDYLLMPEHVAAWEKTNGKIPKGAWVLLRTDWSKRTDAKSFLNVKSDGPHSPGFHKSTSELLARDREVLGVGVETVGTDAGQAGTFDPPFPNHATMHGNGRVRVGEFAKPRSAAAYGGHRDRGAAQDCEWEREPGTSLGAC